MRHAACFLILFCGTALLHAAVLPGFIPPALRPDLPLMVAMIALAFGPREFGLTLLFAMGVQSDLFGSGRFGLLTLSYLLGGGLVVWVAARELTRGDLFSAWLGAIGATLATHAIYFTIGRVCGLDLDLSSALVAIVALLIGAAVWGLPCAYVTGRIMYRMGVLAPNVREKWVTADRLRAARRGRVRA